MFQDRFIYLVTRKLSLEISAGEEKELAGMLTDIQYRKAFDRMEQFWEQKRSADDPDVEAALQRTMALVHETEANEPPAFSTPRKRKRSLALLIAAGLVTGAALSFFLVWHQDKPGPVAKENPAARELLKGSIADTEPVMEKHNTKGTRSLITLADGSTVWLNADSKLTYPQAFNGNTREVALTGEAFFDIVKNRKRPFIIHLTKGSLKVLGTSFNVKAYEGSETIETSVVTGKVAFIPTTVNPSTKTDTTFITPDMKAIYKVSSGQVITVPTVALEDKDWTEGKLVFRNASLREIAEVLNRNFGKDVIFGNEEMANYRLTGSFTNNTLEEILYYLSRSKPFTYRITETQVLLYPIE